MKIKFCAFLFAIAAMLFVDFGSAYAQRYNNYQWQRQQQLQMQRQQQQQQLRQRQLQQQRQRQLQQQRQRQLQQQRQRQLQQQRQRQLQQDRARTQQQIRQGQRRQNNSQQNQQRQSQQRADQLRQRRAQAKAAASSNRCSFHGDTLVLTNRGMLPIKRIEVGADYVWAKDEYTGQVNWKPVIAHYFNTYEETVRISIFDPERGATHSIISNRIHPFFVGGSDPEIPLVNVRHHPSADDLHLNGSWLSADALQPGHRLLSSDGTLDTVESVSVAREALKAFNLTVEGFHTFFVAGAAEAEPVWVHNDCYTAPKNLLGKRFGSLGVVANNPKLRINSVHRHFIDRKIQRGVTSALALATFRRPRLIFKQNGGYLYLTNRAAVFVNNSGKLISTYSHKYFDRITKDALRSADK